MKNPDTAPTLYHPAAAIVVFKPEDSDNDLYLEHYDMDENGCPVNPRPLTVKEAQGLSKALDTRKEAAKAFLKPKGLLPSHVLHINPAENGSVVWYTKPTRCNRFFGTGWKAVNKKFDSKTGQAKAAIYISCVDTAAARFEIAEVLKEATGGSHYANIPRYWMDFGNGKDSGQVVLSTIGSIRQPKSEKFITVESLPFVTEEFGELLRQSDDDDLPSCSIAEALEKQDLFINSLLTQLGCSLLWQLFRKGYTVSRGCFLNLADFRAAPLLL